MERIEHKNVEREKKKRRKWKEENLKRWKAVPSVKFNFL